MNLSDFMDGGKPISYENARKYFGKDPAQKWAAYVAGTILVLMRELGVQFEDSISMLVSISLFYVCSQISKCKYVGLKSWFLLDDKF